MVFFPKETEEEYDARLGIKPEIRALQRRGNVTVEEWNSIRGNSFEFELLYPCLNDEALVFVIEHCMKNMYFDNSRPARSYNEAFMGILGPILLGRFKELRAGLNKTIADLKKGSL